MSATRPFTHLHVHTQYPGPSEVRLRVRGPARTTVYRLGYRVSAHPGFWADLKAAVAVTRAV
ncbi:hypothetical protein [Streptomyces sp. BRA346]|uniref:hypothetical protein n=1 Tax=Streptomyces sp. BRA346 TaxID=2878199 RepID=UPI004062DA7F